MNDTPVEIPANPLVPTGWASIRIALLLLVGAMAGLGLIPEEWSTWLEANIDPLFTAVSVIAAISLSVWRTYRSADKASIAAEAAPNSVAVLK